MEANGNGKPNKPYISPEIAEQAAKGVERAEQLTDMLLKASPTLDHALITAVTVTAMVVARQTRTKEQYLKIVNEVYVMLQTFPGAPRS